MINLDWARRILANGYDSSNRPKNGVTKAKINGKEVTIDYGGKIRKLNWRSSDVYPLNRGKKDDE